MLTLIVCADPRPRHVAWEWGSLRLEAGAGFGIWLNIISSFEFVWFFLLNRKMTKSSKRCVIFSFNVIFRVLSLYFQSDIMSMRYRKIREKIAIWPHCILLMPMCMIRGRTIWSLKMNVASIDTQSIWSSRVCSQVLFPIYFSIILLNFMVYSIAVCLGYWSLLLLLLLLRLSLVRMKMKLISNKLMFIYVDLKWVAILFGKERKNEKKMWRIQSDSEWKWIWHSSNCCVNSAMWESINSMNFKQCTLGTFFLFQTDTKINWNFSWTRNANAKLFSLASIIIMISTVNSNNNHNNNNNNKQILHITEKCSLLWVSVCSLCVHLTIK